MLIIVSSPTAVAPNGIPYSDLIKVLIEYRAQGYPVALVSNHGEPNWFQSQFEGTGVQFLTIPGRQDGKVIAFNADKFQLEPYDVIVLAANSEDIQMGKNGGALLVAAGWSRDRQVQGLGIGIDNAAEFKEVISLTAGWPGQWWYSRDSPIYSVRALTDLSGYGKSMTQQVFADMVKATVKSGGPNLKALLAIASRSCLKEGIGKKEGLLWGVYPSSNSTNNDQEILSDFTHRLRTNVSRVRFANKGNPLFIRHSPSPKRSSGAGGDRTDPTSQITTIHVNPYYRDRIINRNVILIDDCTTYGVSFGVAAAFLRKAGAASVTGIALGKFGDRLGLYDIAINADPFDRVQNTQFIVNEKNEHFPGIINPTAQNTLQSLIV